MLHNKQKRLVKTHSIVGVLCLIGLLVLLSSNLYAWSTSNGVTVSTAYFNQNAPIITSDSAGGAIIVWLDYGSNITTADLYAERLDTSGNSLWALNGVPICTQPLGQATPAIISDEANGAIVTWQDNRSGTTGIYAERLDPNGNSLWTANGIAVCTAAVINGTNAIGQLNPKLVSDGAGGAIITWQDNRNTTKTGTFSGIYAQRVDLNGNPLWSANGVLICTTLNKKNSTTPQIVSDGVGGAIIAWVDSRNVPSNSTTQGDGTDIYAQRVDSNGNTLWVFDGVSICTATTNQNSVQIVSNGAGGAIITWVDLRNGTNDQDIYATAVDSTGTVISGWGSPVGTGIAVCTASFTQNNEQIVTDGSGGAWIVWTDARTASQNNNTFIQHLNSSGVPLLAIDGVAICTAVNGSTVPQLVSDLNGGVLVTWQDARTGNGDIYCQRIDLNGNVLFASDGEAVCVEPNTQAVPQITTDGAGGAIITWQDNRNVFNAIYAQSVNVNGFINTLPPIAGFFGTPTVGTGPLNVSFVDTTENNPTEWSWDFGDGIGTSTVQSPTYQYGAVTAPTLYTVTLIATNPFGTSTSIISNYIEVVPPAIPIAGFFGSPTAGVSPLTVSFADTSGNFPTSWQWNFGDGDSATTQFVSYTYNTTGTFTVRLIATNSYGSGTATITNYITVLPPAVPNPGFYGIPTTGNGPLTVFFFDTSGNYPTYWLWDYGDGSNPDTTQFTTHVFAASTVAQAYTVTLVVANSNGTTQVAQPNYIYVTSTTSAPLFITALPDIKMYVGQTQLNPAFNIPDYVSEGGNPDTYSTVSNFLLLSSVSGTSVSQGSYTDATVGLNSYQIAGTNGTTTASYEAKYSTYKIYKLPKIGLNIGESYTLNVANYTYDSTGQPTQAIPASYGSSNALIITDTTKVSAVWSGNTAVTVTALAAIGGSDLVEVIASPSASPPFVDYDKEDIAVYTNIFNHGTFATAADTTAYGLEVSPSATHQTMATQTWLASQADGAGNLASGVWAFNFANANSGIKFTPFSANYISVLSTQWYKIRARVAASGANTHQFDLFGFSNIIIQNQNTDIAANILFGTPTVWTWVEAPMYVHLNSLSAYPQIIMNAGGAGSIFIDEIQIINAAPTLVDANRLSTRLYYPYGTFANLLDTTGFGQQFFNSNVTQGPQVSVVTPGYLRLDFTGAGPSPNELGIKWTANNGVGGTIYTPPVASVGSEVGVRMNLTRESGQFNSLGVVLIAAYGVQSSGQASIGVPNSNLIAAAQLGQLIEGSMRTVGASVNPFYQFQFGLLIDQPGVLDVSNFDFDSDNDDPNFGDSSLF